MYKTLKCAYIPQRGLFVQLEKAYFKAYLSNHEMAFKRKFVGLLNRYKVRCFKNDKRIVNAYKHSFTKSSLASGVFFTANKVAKSETI